MDYALVTGASSGIGWHLSLELANRGYSIVAVSNQTTELQILKDHLGQNYAVSCYTLCIDLTSEDAAQKVYDFCEENGLNIGVLINNAGILMLGESISQTHSEVGRILTLHIKVLTDLCMLFAKNMKEENTGYILNVSSISSVMPYPVISLYGPSKTYVRYFTRALRIELDEYNIKVSCLLPGATNTPLNDPLKVNTELAVRLGVMMEPEKVAKIAIRGLMRNKAEIIPGFINKITLIMLPIIPRFLIKWIYQSNWTRKIGEKYT